MALDIEGIAREVLTSALQGGNGNSKLAQQKSGSNGGLSGLKGLAAGAGAAALAPAAFKAAKKLADGLGVDSLTDAVKSPGEAVSGATSKVGDRVASGAKDKAQEALGEAGGPAGMLGDAVKGLLPFGGGGGGSKNDAQGAGKGRRMPVQQSIDIGLPVETVYNQWTQFEEWPKFMHRVTRATQDDDCTVSFATKIWGKTKEFKAQIQTQRPDERIKWKVSEGMTHTGVVTFHELGPNLTRVMLSFDVDPGSLLEKFARGARHVKRAARGDLHRFKAFVEMAEHETGAWRGVIEDGELVEEHDPSYDEGREYSDVEELVGEDSDDDDDEQDDSESGDEDSGDDEDSAEEERSRAARGGGSARQATKRGRSQSRGRKSSSSGSSQSRGRKAQSSGRSSSARKSQSSGRKSQSSGSKSRSNGRKSSSTTKSSSARKSQSSGRGRTSSSSTSRGRSRGSSNGSSNGRSRSGSRSRSRSRNS